MGRHQIIPIQSDVSLEIDHGNESILLWGRDTMEEICIAVNTADAARRLGRALLYFAEDLQEVENGRYNPMKEAPE